MNVPLKGICTVYILGILYDLMIFSISLLSPHISGLYKRDLDQPEDNVVCVCVFFFSTRLERLVQTLLFSFNCWVQFHTTYCVMFPWALERGGSISAEVPQASWVQQVVIATSFSVLQRRANQTPWLVSSLRHMWVTLDTFLQ